MRRPFCVACGPAAWQGRGPTHELQERHLPRVLRPPPSAGTTLMLQALTLNCTLKKTDPAHPSSTARLLGEVEAEWRKLGISVDSVRAADLNLLPGVPSDEGPGDDWPDVRRRILAADLFVLGTPIW